MASYLLSLALPPSLSPHQICSGTNYPASPLTSFSCLKSPFPKQLLPDLNPSSRVLPNLLGSGLGPSAARALPLQGLTAHVCFVKTIPTSLGSLHHPPPPQLTFSKAPYLYINTSAGPAWGDPLIYNYFGAAREALLSQ